MHTKKKVCHLFPSFASGCHCLVVAVSSPGKRMPLKCRCGVGASNMQYINIIQADSYRVHANGCMQMNLQTIVGSIFAFSVSNEYLEWRGTSKDSQGLCEYSLFGSFNPASTQAAFSWMSNKLPEWGQFPFSIALVVVVCLYTLKICLVFENALMW